MTIAWRIRALIVRTSVISKSKTCGPDGFHHLLPPGQKKVPYSCNHLAFILLFFVTVLFWSVIRTISCKKISEICACEVSRITAVQRIDTLLFPKMLNLQLKMPLMITADG